MVFNLEQFEYFSYNRQHEAAARMLVQLLTLLDQSYGDPSKFYQAKPLKAVADGFQESHILNRTVAAITCLLTDKDFNFSPDVQGHLFAHQRWLATIFGASDFVNADHVLQALNLSGQDAKASLQLRPEDLLKFCLLYVPDSEIPIELDSIFRASKDLAVALCMALISPRFLGSQQAHNKREVLLPWLARNLSALENFDKLPIGILHDVYMHCSYADRADKHDVKAAINTSLKRWLTANQIEDIDLPAQLPINGGKPVLLVVMEWFNIGHSIYRTHSRTLEAAKQHFYVLGMGLGIATDDAGRAVFDEFIEIDAKGIPEQLRQIRRVAQDRKAQVFYMPSVGMFPITLYLACLRLAPVMAMALGHPATSRSPVMDYVVVEEDYVGDPACFSEKLLILPKDGMPYRPSGLAAPEIKPMIIREQPEQMNICVAASVMKINPGFLNACKVIAERSPIPVKFHFLVGQAIGLVYRQVSRVVNSFLRDSAVVYRHTPYVGYMEVVRNCDMFINPFPFGNTNGIIDCITAGLVGICKSGREVNEHIDEGLFKRFDFPDWLITRDTDSYINASLRLIQDHDLRNDLRRQLTGPDKVERIFHGRPEIMGQKFMDVLENKIQFTTVADPAYEGV